MAVFVVSTYASDAQTGWGFRVLYGMRSCPSIDHALKLAMVACENRMETIIHPLSLQLNREFAFIEPQPMTRKIVSIRMWICVSVLAACIGLQPILIVRNTMIRVLSAGWWDGHSIDFSSHWSEIDHPILSLPGNRNLAAVFLGFSPTNENDKNFIAEFSHRGSYALYPRKLVVADEGQIIGGGDSIIRQPFRPSVEWLNQNDVSHLLRLVRQPDGEARLYTLPVR